MYELSKSNPTQCTNNIIAISSLHCKVILYPDLYCCKNKLYNLRWEKMKRFELAKTLIETEKTSENKIFMNEISSAFKSLFHHRYCYPALKFISVHPLNLIYQMPFHHKEHTAALEDLVTCYAHIEIIL